MTAKLEYHSETARQAGSIGADMEHVGELRRVVELVDPAHLKAKDVLALLGLAHAAMTVAAKIAPPPARLGVVQS